MSQSRGGGSAARPRSQQPVSISSSTNSPLLSSSTVTFLASWRGQLLICSVVLILGGIYFVLQEPISSYRRRRKEAISRVREEELMSMEKDQGEKETVVDDVNAKDSKRGREKRKDVKKRKGSLLKVPIVGGGGGGESSATGPSSIESSPAPNKSFLPPSKPRSSPSPSQPKPSALPQHPNSETTDTTAANSHSIPAPHLTLSPPAPIVARSVSPPPDSQSRLAAPWEIPLPLSPNAGPSRLNGSSIPESDQESVDGDGGNTSESVHSNLQNGEQSGSDTRPNRLSEGFSIIPEEGYLPSTISMSNKKKKHKGRSAPPPSLPSLSSLDRRDARPSTNSATDHTPQTPGRSTIPASPGPLTPSSRARKASLTRPVNADLDGLLTERERMIESLRAEIGMAKAEEAKAREEASRGKATEERLKGDVERARKISQKVEHEGRKRESELTARLSQLSSHYTAALHRLNTVESILRETGQSLPPPSPAIPGTVHQQSPISIQHLQQQHQQQAASPLPPGSPYLINFGPSPRQGVPMGFVPYPSPGMFPSPMLHPHFHPAHPHSHSHSPSPYRRSSLTGPPDDSVSGLAGPLTPGQPQPTPGSGSYPFDLGIMPLGSPAIPTGPAARLPSPNGQLSAADIRRISIESSVLKKKVQQDTERSNSDSGEGSIKGVEAALPDIEEVQGLGVGQLEGVQGGFNGQRITNGNGVNGNGVTNGVHHPEDAGSGDSHPSSPSPPNRASMLLTPASADLFHRALGSVSVSVNGTTTPEVYGSTSRSASDLDLEGIKMIQDSANGNLYYHATHQTQSQSHSRSRSRSPSNSNSEGRSENASAYEPNGGEDQSTEDTGEGDTREREKDEEFVPMFASLAHTPQQLAEIQKMREEALKAREKSTDRVRGRGGVRMVSASQVQAGTASE